MLKHHEDHEARGQHNDEHAHDALLRQLVAAQLELRGSRDIESTVNVS
jgi:hypothetical protein